MTAWLRFGALGILCGVAACEPPERFSTPAAEPSPGVPAGPDGIQLAYAKPGDRIELTGRVVAASEGSLLLDYGTGRIRVRLRAGEPDLTPGSETVVVGSFGTDGGTGVISGARSRPVSADPRAAA